MAEPFFYRSKKERSYTVVDNTFIRDERLSWKAKGLMTYLLSLPEDWKIYMKEIVNHSSDGEAGLRSAIKELTKYGYIKFERKRNEKGVFMQGIYKIIENPHLENPNVDNPDLENRTLLNTNKQNTDNNKRQTCAEAQSFEKPTPKEVFAFYHENKLAIKPDRFWNYNNKKKWKVKDWKSAYLGMCERFTLDEEYDESLTFNQSDYDYYSGV